MVGTSWLLKTHSEGVRKGGPKETIWGVPPAGDDASGPGKSSHNRGSAGARYGELPTVV